MKHLAIILSFSLLFTGLAFAKEGAPTQAPSDMPKMTTSDVVSNQKTLTNEELTKAVMEMVTTLQRLDLAMTKIDFVLRQALEDPTLSPTLKPFMEKTQRAWMAEIEKAKAEVLKQKEDEIARLKAEKAELEKKVKRDSE